MILRKAVDSFVSILWAFLKLFSWSCVFFCLNSTFCRGWCGDFWYIYNFFLKVYVYTSKAFIPDPGRTFAWELKCYFYIFPPLLRKLCGGWINKLTRLKVALFQFEKSPCWLRKRHRESCSARQCWDVFDPVTLRGGHQHLQKYWAHLPVGPFSWVRPVSLSVRGFQGSPWRPNLYSFCLDMNKFGVTWFLDSVIQISYLSLFHQISLSCIHYRIRFSLKLEKWSAKVLPSLRNRRTAGDYSSAAL